MRRVQGNLTPIRQSTLVEVLIGTNPGQNEAINFGNQNTLLDNAVITSIEVFDSTILTKSPTGNTVASLADLTKATVTLADLSNGTNFEWLLNYPLANLVTTNNAGILKEILFRYITLNKCNINVVDTSITPGVSIVFAFNYWTPQQYIFYLEQQGLNMEVQNEKKKMLLRNK